MSHFNIIQLCKTRPSKDEHISISNICEDPLFLAESDYGGDEKDLMKVIGTIRDELRPFASVNVRNKTVRFRNRDAVEKKYIKTMNAAMREFRGNMKEKRFSTAEYHLRRDVTEPAGIDDLFYTDYLCKFSTVIADYLAGYLPQTLYFGAVLDAHC